jgi:hypothetical protein
MDVDMENVEEDVERNNTAIMGRSNRGCRYSYWRSYEFSGMRVVKSYSARSLKSCASSCCNNEYCASFDWSLGGKKCYHYNQNINDDINENLVSRSGWYAGYLRTRSSGFSYV